MEDLCVYMKYGGCVYISHMEDLYINVIWSICIYIPYGGSVYIFNKEDLYIYVMLRYRGSVYICNM